MTKKTKHTCGRRRVFRVRFSSLETGPVAVRKMPESCRTGFGEESKKKSAETRRSPHMCLAIKLHCSTNLYAGFPHHARALFMILMVQLSLREHLIEHVGKFFASLLRAASICQQSEL